MKGNAGKKYAQRKAKCAYCGEEFGLSVRERHENVCWQNPALIARFRAAITPGMKAKDYYSISKDLKLPNYIKIAREFGGWKQFVEFVFFERGDEILDVIAEELAMNRAAVEREFAGLPVFDAPRRIVKTGQSTFTIWGVR